MSTASSTTTTPTSGRRSADWREAPYDPSQPDDRRNLLLIAANALHQLRTRRADG